MKLTINGESREFPQNAALSITDLLGALGMAGKPVVVELNQEAVLPGAYATTEAADGSQVEIVLIAAGG